MAHMTQNDAIRVTWDLALQKMNEARKDRDTITRDRWFLMIDLMETEWPWLKRLRHDIPGLSNIPLGETP